MRTQLQMFYDAHAKIAAQNEAMMDMIREGEMTNADLEALIERRPEVYGRFEGFLGKLK